MKLSFVIYAMFALLVVFGAYGTQLPTLPSGELPNRMGNTTYYYNANGTAAGTATTVGR